MRAVCLSSQTGGFLIASRLGIVRAERIKKISRRKRFSDNQLNLPAFLRNHLLEVSRYNIIFFVIIFS